jgi:hypothetical protein
MNHFVLTTVLALLLSVSAVAELPALSPETLPRETRMAGYLRLIENFVGWVEAKETFVEAKTLEPGGGYFEAAGKGVTWARGNSNLCIAYAVLLTANPDRESFCDGKVSRAMLLDHARRAMRALARANTNSPRHKKSKLDWGGPSWQAALEFAGCAWAAHLLADQLDAETLELVSEVVIAEANHLDKDIPSAEAGNTGSEDCSWNAPLLAFAACKYPDHPQAQHWDELAKRWGINSVSAPQDKTSEEIIDGKPVKDWIVSQNLFDDLTMENHGFWSVPYQFSVELLGEAELAYQYFGKPVPQAFSYHAQEMWDTVNGVLSLWDGDTLFPHGQDWAWKDMQHLEYFAWQASCRNNAAATAFESRALQMLLRRQASIGTGNMKALDLGYQTVHAKRWAFSWLMHQQFPREETMPFKEAEAPFYGVHVYPHMKTAIHRTPGKLVSVSWHPHSQAIFVLPEGDSNFSDPPFFIPYDRDMGVTQVLYNGEEVKKIEGEIQLLLARENTDEDSKGPYLQPGGGLEIIYRIPRPENNWQYVVVRSWPDEVTGYFSYLLPQNYRSPRDVDKDSPLTFGYVFPQRIGMPPGFTLMPNASFDTTTVNWADRLLNRSGSPISILGDNKIASRFEPIGIGIPRVAISTPATPDDFSGVPIDSMILHEPDTLLDIVPSLPPRILWVAWLPGEARNGKN